MIGLALEGGGAKGAFQMGALKAFFEEGYDFGGVAGTSIGALNGAIIAQGDFKLGYNWWERADTSLLFDIEQAQLQKFINKKIDKKALIYLSSKIKDIIENRGIDTRKIRKTLDKIINEKKLRQSKIDFGIVTVSLSDLKPLELYKEDIPKGKMVNYLMASANLPIFKIQPIEGKFYIDGCFYDNCPINLLVRKGYKEIIAIRTLGMGFVRKVKDKNIKVTNIIPSEDLGTVLNFDNNHIKRNLKLGYCDAMRTIKGLKGRKYYIESTADEDLFFYSLLSVSEDVIQKIGGIMVLPKMEPKRMLFEKILPSLSNMLGLSTRATYGDIIIGILEWMAEERKIDRYKIRSFGNFLEDIKSTSVKRKSDSNSSVLEISRLTKLAHVSVKSIILKKIGEELIKVLKEESMDY